MPSRMVEAGFLLLLLLLVCASISPSSVSSHDAVCVERRLGEGWGKQEAAAAGVLLSCAGRSFCCLWMGVWERWVGGVVWVGPQNWEETRRTLLSPPAPNGPLWRSASSLFFAPMPRGHMQHLPHHHHTQAHLHLDNRVALLAHLAAASILLFVLLFPLPACPS